MNRKYIWAVWGMLLLINLGFTWEFQNLGAARCRICFDKKVDTNICKAFDVRFCGYNNSDFTEFKETLGEQGIQGYKDQLEGIDRWFPFCYLLLGLFSLLLLKDSISKRWFWIMLCLLMAACLLDSLENLRNLKMLENVRMPDGYSTETYYYTVIKFVSIVISYLYLLVMGLYHSYMYFFSKKSIKSIETQAH